jgi:hypothetical protein
MCFSSAAGFYQVLLLQPDVYDVPFPRVYLQFLDALGSFAFVGFDLPLMFKVECLVQTNYHSRVYAAAIGSALVLGVLSFALVRTTMKSRGRSQTLLQKAAAKEASGRKLLAKEASGRKFLSFCLVLSYLVYPSSSSVFFQTFNCRWIDSVEYHTKDTGIKCQEQPHMNAETLATAMIGCFSFGLPLLYLSLLIPQRNKLVSSSTVPDDSHVRMDFFIKDYKVNKLLSVHFNLFVSSI